jgi:hypothetical protein
VDEICALQGYYSIVVIPYQCFRITYGPICKDLGFLTLADRSNKLSRNVCKVLTTLQCTMGHVVAQLVEVLCYKPECHWFDCR